MVKVLSNLDAIIKPSIEEKKESRLDKEMERYRAVKELLDRSNAELEVSRLNQKVENLAKKLARGEHLTESERALLEKHNPEKMRKAHMANLRRKNIEEQLKNARTKEEANSILMGASGEVAVAFDKDEEYGELLSGAVNKVITDYAQGKKDKTTYLQFKSINMKV